MERDCTGFRRPPFLADIGQQTMSVNLTGIQTIVFDLDDTLCSERDFAFSGFAAVSDWLAERWTCPFDAEKRMQALFETDSRRTIFNQILREAGCPGDQEMVPAMIECYRNHMPAIELHRDADRAIRRWRGAFFLALISDGPLNMQEQKVKALQLAQQLDLIVLTDIWGAEFWKPHPRAYELVEERSGHRGEACVYLADNPAKDFLTPNRRGWRTIRIRRPSCLYRGVEPAPGGAAQFEVQSLDEVDITC